MLYRTDEGVICTFDDFATANADTPDVIADVRALPLCGVHTGGGGAWAGFTVTRIPTVEETRAEVAALPPAERCGATCPGWAIFESDAHGTEIERCDECSAARVKMGRPELRDDDFQRLPEADAALAAFLCVDAVFHCECSWLGGDPDVRRGKNKPPTCPACWHHDHKRVTVTVEPGWVNPTTPDVDKETANG